MGSAEAAQREAERIGYPVALKVADPTVVHKSDVGGVRLDLADTPSLHQAYEAMVETLPQARDGVVVQRMVSRGVEMIVGVVRDKLFGPVVMVGLGGTATELLADRSVRVPPLEPSDAAEMIATLRSAPLLHGYRGAGPCDVAALKQLILRVGRLAEDLPEVAELDLNPVMALPEGAVVADVKIRLEPAPRRLSPLLREL